MTRETVLAALSEFQRNRREHYGIHRIGIFGSAARDRLTEESDVDIVVELAHPDLLKLVGIKQELEEVLDRPVDVVRYRDQMSAFLKHRLEQEAVYV